MAGLLETYRDLLALPPDYPIISLEEGKTPLIPAPKLAARMKVPGLRLFLKFEGLNPTGSFKDRGMTYAVSQAVAERARCIICASTGNTSASAAAYGARAGLETFIIIPEGKVALGKLSQAMMYGARIVQIQGNFDQALDIVRQLGETGKVTVVNSINPYRILGQQTAAFEIVETLGSAPDYLFIPVGNAGNITAYWKGFQTYQQHKGSTLPKMFGYEAEGSAAIVYDRVIEAPETFATAIRIGNPASWKGAVAARDESGGRIDAVSDAEIAQAYQLLAREEGVFCEPASAASVAGLLKATQQGQVADQATVVCVLTGNGLKDPDNAIQYGAAETTLLPPDVGQIAAFFRL